MHQQPDALHLIGAPDAGAVKVVLREVPGRLPVVAYLGTAGPLRAGDLAEIRTSGETALLPEAAAGESGRPGLRGHRRDADRPRGWTTAFVPTSVEADADGATILAEDQDAGLALRTEVQVVAGGLVRARHRVTNRLPSPYVVEGLDVAFPLPDHAVEMLDFTGRWGRERAPQRRPIGDGLWLRESRHGRPGHDSAFLTVAGTAGFDFAAGEVWGLHVAWSGNHAHRLERLAPGQLHPGGTTIGGGELLLPGEVVLGAGEAYTTPWVYVGSADTGLDGLAARFHAHLRSLPSHPSGPRPVTLNVWEAVYFDHDQDRLIDLAERAARLGVERYVLDDGWFGARRDDTAGLGDWVVSPEVWPDGLAPLVDRVHDLGMQFGLWFEPEMVNPDSDLYRARPEWILSAGSRTPPPHRNQQVLDLTQPGAFAHVRDQVSAVLAAHRVDYVKWDHNRDLVEPGSATRGGAPAVREQTRAFHALLDELRSRHPDVEWESCASGGGRIDLEVLGRVQRVWTSDQNDALARQEIQRWTAQVVPLEYLGAHVCGPVCHQSGRVLPLSFRAGTALFGHFGIEWDLTGATEQELAELAGWIAAYRDHRALLHRGRLLRADSPVDQVRLTGVVSADRSAALVAYVQMDDYAPAPPAWRIPGLDPAATYRVHRVGPPAPTPGWSAPARVRGAVAAAVGLPAPARRPVSVVVAHLERDDRDDRDDRDERGQPPRTVTRG